MVMAIIISLVLLFLGIGILVLIHLCIVAGAFRRGFAGDNNNTAERGSLESTSMSRDDIEKLPSFDFRDRAKGSSPVDCAVCLENFKAGDKCRLLPICKHSFHAQCVDLWLLKTPFCPICRTNNGAWRVGSMSGEESSLFSESGYLNEITFGLVGQSGHFSEAAVELGDNQTGNNENLSEIVVELRENQTIENSNFTENLCDVISAESGHLSDVCVELSDNPTGDNSCSGDSGKNNTGEKSGSTTVMK